MVNFCHSIPNLDAGRLVGCFCFTFHSQRRFPSTTQSRLPCVSHLAQLCTPVAHRGVPRYVKNGEGELPLEHHHRRLFYIPYSAAR
jgi:hypothetical protein